MQVSFCRYLITVTSAFDCPPSWQITALLAEMQEGWDRMELISTSEARALPLFCDETTCLRTEKLRLSREKSEVCLLCRRKWLIVLFLVQSFISVPVIFIYHLRYMTDKKKFFSAIISFAGQFNNIRITPFCPSRYVLDILLCGKDSFGLGRYLGHRLSRSSPQEIFLHLLSFHLWNSWHFIGRCLFLSVCSLNEVTISNQWNVSCII